jgi:hypothetical protein
MQRLGKRNDTYILLVLLGGSNGLGGDVGRVFNDWRDGLDGLGLGLSGGRHYVVRGNVTGNRTGTGQQRKEGRRGTTTRPESGGEWEEDVEEGVAEKRDSR